MESGITCTLLPEVVERGGKGEGARLKFSLSWHLGSRPTTGMREDIPPLIPL